MMVVYSTELARMMVLSSMQSASRASAHRDGHAEGHHPAATTPMPRASQGQHLRGLGLRRGLGCLTGIAVLLRGLLVLVLVRLAGLQLGRRLPVGPRGPEGSALLAGLTAAGRLRRLRLAAAVSLRPTGLHRCRVAGIPVLFVWCCMLTGDWKEEQCHTKHRSQLTQLRTQQAPDAGPR